MPDYTMISDNELGYFDYCRSEEIFAMLMGIMSEDSTMKVTFSLEELLFTYRFKESGKAKFNVIIISKLKNLKSSKNDE